VYEKRVLPHTEQALEGGFRPGLSFAEDAQPCRGTSLIEKLRAQPSPPSSRVLPYRGTSLIRNRAPLGPYSRTMPMALWKPWGGGLFLMSEVPLYKRPLARAQPRAESGSASFSREFVDYKTSMVTDEDPLRGLLFN